MFFKASLLARLPVRQPDYASLDIVNQSVIRYSRPGVPPGTPCRRSDGLREGSISRVIELALLAQFREA
jgi:hypothetical protein